MTHVLHIVGTAADPGRSITGIVETLTALLAPRGYTSTVLFLGGDGPARRRLEQRGVETLCVPWRYGVRDPIGALRLAWRLRLLRPDIVHQHFGGRSVRRLVRAVTGAPILMHLHSRGPEASASNRRPFRVPAADVVIAPCRAVAALIETPKAQVVYTGVAVAPIGEAPGRPLLIGSAARLVPIKSISTFIEAVALLRAEFPSVRFEIAGDGPSRSALECLTKRLGCDEVVAFLGFQHDLSACFRRWTVFVLPSIDEAMPVALLQAMSAGLVPVASAVGGVPEVVSDDQNGLLVPPANAAALAGAIRRLLVNPELRRSLAYSARATVQREFTRERMADAFAAVYESLLRHHRSTG